MNVGNTLAFLYSLGSTDNVAAPANHLQRLRSVPPNCARSKSSYVTRRVTDEVIGNDVKMEGVFGGDIAGMSPDFGVRSFCSTFRGAQHVYRTVHET